MSESFKIQQPEEIETLDEAREYIARLHAELDDVGLTALYNQESKTFWKSAAGHWQERALRAEGASVFEA